MLPNHVQPGQTDPHAPNVGGADVLFGGPVYFTLFALCRTPRAAHNFIYTSTHSPRDSCTGHNVCFILLWGRETVLMPLQCSRHNSRFVTVL